MIISQIVIAWLYGHIMEYSLHRWLLHKWGAKKGRLLSFHFYGHHSSARLNSFKDSAYSGIPLRFDAAGKELFSLLLILGIHFPLFAYFPWAYWTLVFSSCSYYYTHRRSHQDPEWAKKKIPWHYDHHMALNQNKNFGVRSDLIDKVLGTRQRYL